GVPAHGRLGSVADAGGVGAAELGPVSGRGRGGAGCEQPKCVLHGATVFLNWKVIPPCLRVKLLSESNSITNWAGVNSKTVGLFGLGANSPWPLAWTKSLPSLTETLISSGNCSLL